MSPLIGAAEAMMEAQGFAWLPDERSHYEKTWLLPDAVESDELERVRAAGSAMTARVAVDFTLGGRGLRA